MRRAQLALGASLAAMALLSQGGTRAASPQPNPSGAENTIFAIASGLGSGWKDLGWAPRVIQRGQPLSLDLSGSNGWIVEHKDLKGTFGGVHLRLRSPIDVTSFLDLTLDGSPTTSFPRVQVNKEQVHPGEDGWSEVLVPMGVLNPRREPFDRVFLRSRKVPGALKISIAEMDLAPASQDLPAAPASPPQAEAITGAIPVQLVVDCAVPARPVSPRIFGIAWKPGYDQADKHQWLLGATTRRFGGNPASRYNWSLGNAWNTADDWFFMNVDYTGQAGWSWRSLLDDDRAHGVSTAIVVPMLGWVAKDTTSYSFPVSVYGRQAAVAPEKPDAGNGVSPSGQPIAPGPPTRTSVASTPDDVRRWVEAIGEPDRTLGGARSVGVYILDNEPMLWNTTHRDVHPRPASYDELLRKTIAYAKAIRAADPDARIAGPALWGWPAYMYSAVDAAAGFAVHPDRLSHGNEPLLPWWLDKVRAEERRTGTRLLDVVDVHFYPQGDGIGGQHPRTDTETSARRIRSTRALWDPTYKDESWIDDRIELLPRLHRWIDEHHPGAGIQIGEYNFGAEEHMSGALALAEALGRFAEGGVEAAYYWTYPAKDSPAFWAFRAYRNFDGQGGHFLDQLVPTEGSTSFVSLFASRNEIGDRAVLVLLNLDPQTPLEANIDLGSCGTLRDGRVFSYSGGTDGPHAVPSGPLHTTGLRQTVPAYSITVIDLGLGPSPPSAETTAEPSTEIASP
jgi:hypothetical protein